MFACCAAVQIVSYSVSNGWSHIALWYQLAPAISYHFQDCKALLDSSHSCINSTIAGRPTRPTTPALIWSASRSRCIRFPERLQNFVWLHHYWRSIVSLTRGRSAFIVFRQGLEPGNSHSKRSIQQRLSTCLRCQALVNIDQSSRCPWRNVDWMPHRHNSTGENYPVAVLCFRQLSGRVIFTTQPQVWSAKRVQNWMLNLTAIVAEFMSDV